MGIQTKAVAQTTLTPTFQGVDYVGQGSIHQKMDIYIPPGLTGPAPVIVFIHGGGWVGGGKGAPNVPYFEPSYKAGFICVDINYRLSSVNIWPAQIEDCKAAVRFLKANATTYNIDACRFGVMGSSAGGHLAAMMGTSAEVTALEGASLGNATQSSRIQAVVDLFGPTDFSKMDGNYSPSCGTNGSVHESRSFETNLLGISTLSADPAKVQSANPITYISADDAKFFIMHGSNDCSVPTNQSVLLHDALLAAGLSSTYTVAQSQGHGGAWYQHVVRGEMYRDFFLSVLGTPCGTSGIEETSSQALLVSPNPVNHTLQLSLPGEVIRMVDIYNALGARVLNVAESSSIDVSALPAGVYMLLAQGDAASYSAKVIKY